jgi:hypothetical protein
MAQKTKSKPTLDAATSSTDALKALGTTDVSKATVKEAQLQEVLDGLTSFQTYLETNQFLADTKFKKNIWDILSRLASLQMQADKGWVDSKKDTRSELYSDIKLYAYDCAEKLKKVVIPTRAESKILKDAPVAPKDDFRIKIMQTEAPVGIISTQMPWTVTIDSLPARTAGFIKTDADQGRARELIGKVLSPYLNYLHSTTEVERNRYVKDMAKAASRLIDFLGSLYPQKERENALGRMICGRVSQSECSATLNAMQNGDVATIERLLQEGNSPLAEFMEEALNTTEGEYRISIPYMVLDPSVRAMLGRHSYIEAELLIVGIRNLTESRARDSAGALGSEFGSDTEFRLNPQLRLGAKVPIGGEAGRLSLGMEGGAGAFNPYWLKKNEYVVGMVGNLSLSGDVNITDNTALQLNLEVDVKHGMGKNGFTELLERADLVFMTFQFNNRVGLGAVVRADAVQVLADSFVVPLHGITWDAGLANQLILSSKEKGTVNIYFAGGYTEQRDKLQGVGQWGLSRGGWFQVNTGQEGKVSGGLGMRILERPNIPRVPASELPFIISVGGKLTLDF